MNNNIVKEQKPFYKRKVFLIVAFIAILAIMGKTFNSKEHQPVANNTDNEKAIEQQANEKALAAIRQEKKVAEAIISDANVLYVSVKDDGTRRNGYAEYLCQILKENHSKVNWVKITKVGSTNDPKRDNAYGVLLGECHCR